MSDVSMIFNACTEIMRYKVNLCGYDVSIMQAIVFAFLGGVLFSLIKEAI